MNFSSLSIKFFLFSFLFSLFIFYFLPLPSPKLSLILGIFTLLLVFFFRKNLYSQKILLLFLGLSLGVLRLYFNLHIPTSQTIDFYNNTTPTITVKGYICAEPDLRQKEGKYTFCSQRIDWEHLSQNVSGKMLVSLPRYPEFLYGESLILKGKLKEPPQFDDFNYQNYLSRYKIFSLMYFPKTENLNNNQGSFFFRNIFQWKKTVEKQIKFIFPEPNSSFLAGLLIGARRNIPESVLANFNQTGLSHIIAISGYNITIIIAFILGLLSFLPRKISFYCALGGVVVFTFFVGASAAVVRASIMGILGLIALHHGRQADVLILILLSASLMLLFNPSILWYDIGFQLSFLAVLGIVYITPFFEKWSQNIPQTLGFKEAFLMTISAQITAVPLIVFNFDRLSLIAPLANLLVAPLIPLAMLFGFLAIVVSFLNFQLGLILGFLGYICCELILIIADTLAKVPYASIEIKNFSFVFVSAYYLFLILLILYKKIKN